MSPLINVWDEMFDYNDPFMLLYSLCNTELMYKFARDRTFSIITVQMGRSSLRYDINDHEKECVGRGIASGVVI
jgi:hypothetical protein